MKFLFTFLSLFLIMSCASQKKPDTKTATTIEKTIQNMPLDIRYEARTRGRSKILHVLENTVTYKTNKEDKTVTLSPETKKEIVEIVSGLDLENMKKLKSPTNKRMFDGAMHTTIKIKKDAKEYASSNFDDGHPPAELQSLVTLLMKVVE